MKRLDPQAQAGCDATWLAPNPMQQAAVAQAHETVQQPLPMPNLRMSMAYCGKIGDRQHICM